MGCPVGESGGGVCGGHGLCDVGDDPTNTVCDDSFFFFFFSIFIDLCFRFANASFRMREEPARNWFVLSRSTI